MLIGHDELRKDLLRLADERRLAHGYIFFGPPMVGKALFAMHLGAYLETGAFEYEAGHTVLGDTLLIEPKPEESSIGIDAVREIKNFLWQTSNRSPYRLVVVAAGELLTEEAENALLKVTEEPSPRGVIIVVLDDPERLLPTLRSRLQKIYFGPVAEGKVALWAEEVLKLGAAEARELARASFGAPGLLYRSQKDKRFKKTRLQAEEYLKTSAAARPAFVKKMVADDDAFDLDDFLGALAMLIYADQKALGRPDHRRLWHELMALRRSAFHTPLNARLQLTALAPLLEARSGSGRSGV
ncbi:MAG TPA: hypothetical protein VMC43_03970 [Candidatus Paceibacterota bacterium]|nr:hypothetical protein [Candidatus Paceibacterota bacterium]